LIFYGVAIAILFFVEGRSLFDFFEGAIMIFGVDGAIAV